MLERLLGLLRPSEPLATGPSRLQERVSALEADLDTLRRDNSRIKQDFDALQLDWATTLNRIGQWASRQAAREQRAAQRALEAGEAPAGADGAPVAPAPTDPRVLTKHQLRQLVASRRAPRSA